jgi:enhancing lycopene biosynthesis protein 2
MTKRVGVLLSGCGVYDGSEIHEAVLTLLAIDRAGARAVCLAPDMAQMHVIDHLTGKESGERRNVLVESARIARGEVLDAATVKASDLDALILPGGFGAAKNLSDFAVKGSEALIQSDVMRLLQEMAAAGKPIGAICISPAVVARALSSRQPEVTIGNDPATAEAIARMGARHQSCSVETIHVDRRNGLVSTPAYMLGPGIKDVAIGIEKLVNQVLAMCA